MERLFCFKVLFSNILRFLVIRDVWCVCVCGFVSLSTAVGSMWTWCGPWNPEKHRFSRAIFRLSQWPTLKLLRVIYLKVKIDGLPIPNGRLVKGQYTPICKDCARYFSTDVLEQMQFKLSFHGPKWLSKVCEWVFLFTPGFQHWEISKCCRSPAS